MNNQTEKVNRAVQQHTRLSRKKASASYKTGHWKTSNQRRKKWKRINIV
jgi:hypothetical protein